MERNHGVQIMKVNKVIAGICALKYLVTRGIMFFHALTFAESQGNYYNIRMHLPRDSVYVTGNAMISDV